MQNVTFKIYPLGKPHGEDWATPAWVYGDWAVHRNHPLEEGQYDGCRWHITQLSTGVLAFVAKHLNVAEDAARKLAAIESPATKLVGGDRDMPHATPPSLDWVNLCADALEGLDVWGVSRGGALIRPSDIASVLEIRAD